MQDFQDKGNFDLLSTAPPSSTVKGFFTNFNYAVFCRDALSLELKLVNPSHWYLEMSADAQRLAPIAVHVRRGDVLNYKDMEGVTGEEYYNEAIRIATQKLGNREIWLFTNDQNVFREWEIFKVFPTRLVVPPQGEVDDPAESLMLMTQAGANIITNSSFSLVGAIFNKHSNLVICPSHATRNGRIKTNDLFPIHWLKLEPRWMD
jgi:hypothetical protein